MYLVRHAQACFGTDDYDRLTETGFTQARLLGVYFARRNIRFDAVYTGTLRRHAQTAQGIAEGHGGEWPPAQRVPELDEYNPEAVVAAFAGALPAKDPAAAEIVDDWLACLHERQLAEEGSVLADGGFCAGGDVEDQLRIGRG